jgi:DNA-binding transcriptional ArsR family regulator
VSPVTPESPKDFPSPVVRIIEALADSNRRRILGELESVDSLSYTALKDSVGLEKGTLNHHLGILSKAGLIRNFLSTAPSDDYHSFYEIAPIGKQVVEGIFSAFEPKTEAAFPARMGTAPAFRFWMRTHATAYLQGFVESSLVSGPFTSGLSVDSNQPWAIRNAPRQRTREPIPALPIPR